MPQEIQRGLPAALAVGINNDAGSIGCGRCCFGNESEKFVQQARETTERPWHCYQRRSDTCCAHGTQAENEKARMA